MQFHFYHASLGKVISSRSYSSFFFLFFFVILRKKNYIKLGRNVGHTFRARLKRSSCNALSCSMIMYTRISWWRYKQNWCNRYITTQYTPNCTRTSVYYVIKRERNKYKSGEEEKRRKKKNSIDNIHTRTNGKGTKKRGWKKSIKQKKKKNNSAEQFDKSAKCESDRGSTNRCHSPPLLLLSEELVYQYIHSVFSF